MANRAGSGGRRAVCDLPKRRSGLRIAASSYCHEAWDAVGDEAADVPDRQEREISMFAVISDIHSNLEALETVLADIDARGVERIICLGDIIGYGANPRECMDLIIDRVEMCICGNHDAAVFYEPYNFNVPAERAAFWTRQMLEDEPSKAARDRRWKFLGGLPVRTVFEGMLLVHGSPRRPINEYLFGDDVYSNPTKLMSNFERFEEVACFVGHTHVPGLFVDDPFFESPEDLSGSMY
ncbi:MAG: metallophosphoesterase, partial [Oricola sp.]|nr:metallophosphoesterase [Oricola sp.]